MKIDDIKQAIIKFWRSENENISLIRDIIIALFVVLIILTALWTYTGQWFGAPMVAIESGSMMHQNEPFGRIGTIDAGDMVLLVKVHGRNDVLTREGERAKGDAGFKSYGDYGDVIVYKKYGRNDEDQIIHRAICWIDYNKKTHTYTIEEYHMYNVSSITIPDIGLINYRPTHSGFITKGDNPITNDRCDQAGGICSEPIKPEWITGKARGELPWVGTINLLFNDFINGRLWSSHPTVSNVPPDSITCLVILISVLVSIPLSFDIYDYYKKNYQKKIS